MEQHHVLGHIADLAAQAEGFDLLDRKPVDQHRALVRAVDVEQHAHQRALARTDAADETDLFARGDAQVEALEQRRRIGVGKVHVAKLDAPLERGHVQRAAVLVDRRDHDLVEGLERHLYLLRAQDQSGELACRREGTAGEHRNSDQLAQRKLAVGDQQRANHHQQYGGQACHHDREVAAKGRPFAHPQGALGNLDGQHFPLAPGPGVGAHALDGVEAVHDLEEVSCALRTFLHIGCEFGGDRLAKPPRYPQCEGDQKQRHRHHPATDHRDDGEEEEHEGHVAEQVQGRRGGELPNRFEVPHHVGQHPAGGRPAGGAQLKRMGEDVRGHRKVGLARGAFHQVAAQQLHDQVEDRDGNRGGGEDPQTVERVVGHYPVIHRHGVEGDHRTEQVDQHGGEQRPAVDPAIGQEGVPEPAPGPWQMVEQAARVEAEDRTNEEPATGMFLLQQVERNPLRAVDPRRGNLDFIAPAMQDCQGIARLVDQQCREHRGANLHGGNSGGAEGESGPGRAFVELNQGNASVGQWHPAGDPPGLDGLAEKAGEKDQSVEQRIGLLMTTRRFVQV